VKESAILLSRKFFDSFLLCHREIELKNKEIRFMFVEGIIKPFIEKLGALGVIAFLVASAGANVSGQSPDEQELRALAAKYFQLYEKQDVKGLLGMWSEKSPDYEATRQSLQKRLGEPANLVMRNLTVGEVKVVGEQASVRVALEMGAPDKGGKPAKGYGRWRRTLHFSRQGRQWQLWRAVSGEEELLAKLAATQSEAERRAIVEGNQELLSAEFISLLNKYARQRFDQGQNAEALFLYELALAAAEKIGDGSGKSEVVRLIGLYHYRQGRRPEGVRFYRESLRLAKEAGNREMEARALNSLGIDHQQRGELEEALGYFQQVRKIAEELEEDALLLAVLNNSALVHKDQIKFELSLEELTQALRLVRKLDNQNHLISTLMNVASIHRLLARHSEALVYLKEAFELAEKLGMPDIGELQMLLGDIYYDQGELTKAVAEYEKAQKIAEALHGTSRIANILTRLSLVHSVLGDTTKSIELNNAALKIATELDDKILAGIILGNLAANYSNEGDYSRTLEYTQKVLVIAEQVGDPDGIVVALGNIGAVFQDQSNYAQALKYHERALTIAEKSASFHPRITVYLRLGYVFVELEDYPKAFKYFDDALRLSKQVTSKTHMVNTLVLLGTLYNQQQNPAKALEYYQEGLKLAEESQYKSFIAACLNGIGRAYQQLGEYPKALDYARGSSAVAKQYNIPRQVWQAELLAGQAHRALKHPELALQAFIQSVRAIEELRAQLIGGEQERQRFFENKSEPYDEIIELLVAQNQTAEALAYAERFKGRVLLDNLQSGKINISRAMSAQELEKERRFRSELISLNTRLTRENQKDKSDETLLRDLQARLQKTRQEYEDFQFQLYGSHPELKVQRGDIQPITLDDVSRLLPDANSGLLEFVVKEDKAFLFVMTRKLKPAGIVSQQSAAPSADIDLRVYPLAIKHKELQSLTQGFVEVISKRSVGYKEAASHLYTTLLKPAQGQLRTLNNLVIVPDDVLWELPFQALQSSANRFLVQDYAISYAPSLTVLREMSRKRQIRRPTTSSTLLAIGNPDIGKATRGRDEPVIMGGQLQPLPEAERQVRSLGQLYGSGQSKTYIGSEAREERLKQEAGAYRILHLATHGILNNASPMYSHLVLSQSAGEVSEDGLLEAWEIMKLELDAELAVLSACDTARGKVSAGEGVIGLSWSLFVAGCPSAVVSQWKVESSSTTELMLEFHRRLKGSATGQSKVSSSKSEALRQASLRLMRSKEYGHPFYWAGFIVVGDNSWR
jgi:CHAT domain-containing protein